MKNLMFAILVCLSTQAFGQSVGQGNFVPDLCSSGSAEWTLCFGQRIGIPGKFVSIAPARVTPRIYLIQKETTFDTGGNRQLPTMQLNLVDQAGNKAVALIRHPLNQLLQVKVIFDNGINFVVGNFGYLTQTRALSSNSQCETPLPGCRGMNLPVCVQGQWQCMPIGH